MAHSKQLQCAAFTFYQKRMREIYSSANFNAPPPNSAVAKALQAKMAFAKAAFNHPGVELWFPDDELGLSGKTHMQGEKTINAHTRQTKSEYEFNAQPYKGEQLGILYSHSVQVLYDFNVECSPLADQCTQDEVTFTGLGVTEIKGAKHYIVHEQSTWEYGNAGASWHWLLPMSLAQTLGLRDFVKI